MSAPASNGPTARVAANVAEVRERLAIAAQRSGRSPADVRLVAVTKYAPEPLVRALVAAGERDLAESRPQELWSRSQWFGGEVRWHLIGHLQRNKLRRTLPVLHLLHSLDSLRLATAIDAEAAQQARTVEVLVEVHLARDAEKQGVAPAELEPMLLELARLKNLRVRGLMTMASREGDITAAEHEFEQLRRLRGDLARRLPENVTLGELSMGMSGDYEAAIRQGATLVRIGSALFAGCD